MKNSKEADFNANHLPNQFTQRHGRTNNLHLDSFLGAKAQSHQGRRGGWLLQKVL